MNAKSTQPATSTTTGEIITFYSYKGGTGRTMSLVNLSCLLAEDLEFGERILLIDWDLEAPGLHRYFHGHLGTADKHGREASKDDAPGVIDLFEELRELGEKAKVKRMRRLDWRAEALFDGITIDDYILKTSIPGIDIVKAGRFDGSYGARVSGFPWEEFYNRHPLAFRELAQRLKQRYRYILIDSRTGQTDTAGICTTLMPEKLVLVFTPNRQSLYGIESVLKNAVAYRRRDSDARPLVAYPLPSRVEVTLDDLRAKWRFGDTAANIEGYESFLTRLLRDAYELRHCHLKGYFEKVQVKHSPIYAFGEEIAVLNERNQGVKDEYSLTHAYRNLLAWIKPGFLPWENPEVIRLLRAIESRSRSETLERRALAEDLQALRKLAQQLLIDGDRGNAELAVRSGERYARKQLGNRHPESIAYANELTEVLFAKGTYAEALEHGRTTLELAKTSLGEEHPDTLNSINNLAGILQAQGDLAGARKYSAVCSARSIQKHSPRSTTSPAPSRPRATSPRRGRCWSRHSQYAAASSVRNILPRSPRSTTSPPPSRPKATSPGRGCCWNRGSRYSAVCSARSIRTRSPRSTTSPAPSTPKATSLGRGRCKSRRSRYAAACSARSIRTRSPRSTTSPPPSTPKAISPERGRWKSRYWQHVAACSARSIRTRSPRSTTSPAPSRPRATSPDRRRCRSRGSRYSAVCSARSIRPRSPRSTTSPASSRPKATSIQRRVLGEEHPETLTSINNLASTLQAQGDLAEARALLESALAIRRRVLGEEHPAALTSINNLAATLYAQGDLTGARALQESALAIRRRVLGEEHPATLSSINNLAGTLQAQGDLTGARALQESALAIQRRVLGEEHPDTLTSMNNLAATLYTQGDLAGARALQGSALAIRRRVLGEEHPATLSSTNNLASTLYAQGDLAGARVLQESALAIRRRAFGDEHPDTLTAMKNLAVTLQAMEQTQAAEVLQQEAGAIHHRNAERNKRRQQGAAVRIAGIGGAGGNALQAIQGLGLRDVGLVAINSDQLALDRSGAEQRVLIGNGLGAGGRADLAELAAEQRKAAIREALEGARLLLIVAGLGGGTGSGAAPVVADVAREMGIVSVAIVTTPFEFEGRRTTLAASAEEKLLRKVDSLIVIRNDDLMEKMGEEATMDAAFASADEEITGVVQGIVEIVTTPGLVNIDLEDLRSIFTGRGRAAAATGLAEGPDRAAAAVTAAIEVVEKKQGFKLATAASVLVNISASRSLSMKEFKQVMETLRPRVSPAASLICGAVFDEKLEGKLRATIIAAGIVTQNIATSGLLKSRSHLATLELPAFLRKQVD
ncbi:MAG: tetratricopeptide repeat protein [Rhodocyclales bacterium]|nr:tetratricopeptide repeat protein [Rhodocyclales bacterium]